MANANLFLNAIGGVNESGNADPETLIPVSSISSATKLYANSFEEAVASLHPVAPPPLIRTNGYYFTGDGGGALYRKMDSEEPDQYGTLTITLADGTATRYAYVNENGEYNPRSFGMSESADDNADRLEGLCRTIGIQLPDDSQDQSSPVIDFGGYAYTYGRMVELDCVDRWRVVLKNGKHLASTSASWGDRDAIFASRRVYVEYHNMTVNPNRMCGAIIPKVHGLVKNCSITNWKPDNSFGVWFAPENDTENPGYKGLTPIQGCHIHMYDQTSPEWDTDDEWPYSPGILVDDTAVDLCFYNNELRFSEPLVHVKGAAGFVIIQGGHMYNYRKNPTSAHQRHMIVDREAYYCQMKDVRTDAGYIDVYNNKFDYIDCAQMIRAEYNTHNTVIRAYANNVDQNQSSVRVINTRRMGSLIPVIQFLDTDDYNWIESFSDINSLLSNDGLSLETNLNYDQINVALGNTAWTDWGWISPLTQARMRLVSGDMIGTPYQAPSLYAEGTRLALASESADALSVHGDSCLEAHIPLQLTATTKATAMAQAANLPNGTLMYVLGAGGSGVNNICYVQSGALYRIAADGQVS